MTSEANFSEDLRPIPSWETPRAIAVGGISMWSNKKALFDQYLNFVCALSEFIPVHFFASNDLVVQLPSMLLSSNVKFFDYNLNTMWIRDYSPIWLRGSGVVKLCNFPYGANYFEKQEHDDQFSAHLAALLKLELAFDFPRKRPEFYFDGGNLQVDDSSICFTAIKDEDKEFPGEEGRKALLEKIGCAKVVFLNPIPGEPTGHVDTFMKIIPGQRVLLAQYECEPYRSAMLENKKILLAEGYEVICVQHSSQHGKQTWSYINSVLVGEHLFVPQYGMAEFDEKALLDYRKTGLQLRPIQADHIMNERGSLHCITAPIY
jgi:agmatine/peptidylarginine deiminase